MLSAAENGTISIWLMKNWSHQCTIKAHKGKITGLAVHPSGLLALSVGIDRSLCMWDLVTKKKVLTIKAKTNSSLLKWSPTGDHYIVVCDTEIRVFDSNAVLVSTLDHSNKVISVCFVSATTLAVGCEDGKIRVWLIEDGFLSHELVRHNVRVSALASVNVEGRTMLASSSSDGSVYVWDLDQNPAPEVIATAQANLRVTTMCAMDTTTFSTPFPGGSIQSSSKPTKKISKKSLKKYVK